MTLTLDHVILHTIMHHSLTSTYMPNFIEIYILKTTLNNKQIEINLGDQWPKQTVLFH